MKPKVMRVSRSSMKMTSCPPRDDTGVAIPLADMKEAHIAYGLHKHR
jgi:hypothetical protein